MKSILRVMLACTIIAGCNTESASVGGTVSGLKGTGLILQRGGEKLPVTADGAFTFQYQIFVGGSYAVTVAQDPSKPSQACAITNDKGTVSAGGVSGVKVVCTTRTFKVGGSVTGLHGELKLQLSGGTTIDIKDNGNFEFPDSLPDMSPYTVAIAAKPETQGCSLTSETGTLDGANVTNVQVNCGDFHSVGGVLKGASGPVELQLSDKTLTVNDNGPFTFADKVTSGSDYEVTVKTPPTQQKCLVSGGKGTVGEADINSISVQCAHWYTFEEKASATKVLGQGTFSTNVGNRNGTVDANTLHAPTGNLLAAGEHLFVADASNNRVLGFAPPAAEGPAAALVLGQPDFVTATPGVSQSAVAGPVGTATNGTKFFVSDAANNRVLVYNSLPSQSSVMPDSVVGQTGFGVAAETCNGSTLRGPGGIAVMGSKLVVADTGHHRVLIWNTIPTTGGTVADLVLGQQTLQQCVDNDTDNNGTKNDAPSAATMNGPTDVWTDGERLIVVDSMNHRVLVWKTFPTSNAQVADLVIGQSDMTKLSSATTQSGLTSPARAVFTGLQLFVADAGNNRILVWNDLPTENGKAADVVLGQHDFVSKVRNNDGSGTEQVSAKGLSNPTGVFPLAGMLWITDSGNHRVLGFASK